MANSEFFAGFSLGSLQIARRLEFATCNLTFRASTGGVEVDCNYHFDLGGDPLDRISSTLNSWQNCQAHLIQEIVPHFNRSCHCQGLSFLEHVMAVTDPVGIDRSPFYTLILGWFCAERTLIVPVIVKVLVSWSTSWRSRTLLELIDHLSTLLFWDGLRRTKVTTRFSSQMFTKAIVRKVLTFFETMRDMNPSVQKKFYFARDEGIENWIRAVLHETMDTIYEYPLWPSSIEEICDILQTQGHGNLAERISYFASDQDLEDDGVPLTLGSAHGFLRFFGAVNSDGRVSLTCSPEGWLCAVWRFPAERRASIWFQDVNQVMFAATNAAGEFIEIDGGGEVGDSGAVMTKLIGAGLLRWNFERAKGNIFWGITYPSAQP